MLFRSLFLFISACALGPSLIPPPLTKNSLSEKEAETLYSAGLITGYEIWEFLRAHPEEDQVIETLGHPDSIWIDDSEAFRVLYYFVSEIQDYNSVEVDQRTGLVLGFEWD